MPALEDEFGDIIAKARRGMGITAERLAEVCGLPVRDIGAMEAYRLTPEDGVIARLAAELSLDGPKLVGIARGVWAPRPMKPTSGLTVDRIEVGLGGYSENSYILGCAQTRRAAVVDPGGEAKRIAETIAERELTVDWILITHAHGDHIGALRELAERYPAARVVSHPFDRESVTQGISNRWEAADDGTRLDLGEIVVTPLFTPGHTPGSMCYSVGGVCFVGDTLFAGSIGGPVSHEVYPGMLGSIRAKVLSLSDSTVLYPGHGPASTVGEEKAHNPFF